jgi:hypothetical protein
MKEKHAGLSILERLFEKLPTAPAEKLGSYDSRTQTWSHRDAQVMSPVKHEREH